MALHFQSDDEVDRKVTDQMRISLRWLTSIFVCFTAVFGLGVWLFGDSLKSFEERMSLLAAFCVVSWFVSPFCFMVKREVGIHTKTPARSVSMHEYLSEKAAWRTTERLDGKTDSDLEPEYNSETHNLVVKGIKCFEIAEDYRRGLTVPENRYLADAWCREAVPWYRRAAEKGDSYAQERMGDFYSEGTGVAPDTKEAFRWWRESANNGRVSAQYRLEKYYFGRQVDKDLLEALFWFQIVLTSHPAGFAEERRQAKIYRDGLTEAMLTAVQRRVEQWLTAHSGNPTTRV